MPFTFSAGKSTAIDQKSKEKIKFVCAHTHTVCDNMRFNNELPDFQTEPQTKKFVCEIHTKRWCARLIKEFTDCFTELL
jgi:hypothetical protein